MISIENIFKEAFIVGLMFVFTRVIIDTLMKTQDIKINSYVLSFSVAILAHIVLDISGLKQYYCEVGKGKCS
jgi:hypothetical protein